MNDSSENGEKPNKRKSRLWLAYPFFLLVIIDLILIIFIQSPQMNYAYYQRILANMDYIGHPYYHAQLELVQVICNLFIAMMGTTVKTIGALITVIFLFIALIRWLRKKPEARQWIYMAILNLMVVFVVINFLVYLGEQFEGTSNACAAD
jgi:hypothetical protein